MAWPFVHILVIPPSLLFCLDSSYVRSICPEICYNTSPSGSWALIVFIALFQCAVPLQIVPGGLSVSLALYGYDRRHGDDTEGEYS